jgi:hypothetical protein
MLTATELAGFIGAGLAGAAYVPQIAHQIRAQCSAGISRLAFGVWLAASLLVTTHAIAIRAAVFIALGAIQLVATALVLIYVTKYEYSYCAIHLPARLEFGPEPGLPPSLPARAGGERAQLGSGVGVPDEQPSVPQTRHRANGGALRDS